MEDDAGDRGTGGGDFINWWLELKYKFCGCRGDTIEALILSRSFLSVTVTLYCSFVNAIYILLTRRRRRRRGA